MKRSVAWGVVLSVGVLAGIGLGLRFGIHPSAQSERVDPMPIVLQSVRSMGELRTSKFTYQNVLTYQTTREPEGWVRVLPGGASLVQAATRNEALVSVQGTVEAGIDLSKAEVLREGDSWVIELPQPKVYEPNVQARVHQQRAGWVWRDINIGLKAERDAANRFRSASLESGILDHARQSATEQVTRFVAQLTEGKVTVRFSS